VKLTNSSSDKGAGGHCYYNGTVYSGRPTIIVNLSRNTNGYPFMKNYRYRIERQEWQEPNKKTGQMETWVWRKHVDDPTQHTKGYINHLELNREESLVYTLAHEFRHFWQSNHKGKRGKVWGAKGKISERDASAYGIRKMREWRTLVSPKQIFREVPW
jgi:hypothetical protein